MPPKTKKKPTPEELLTEVKGQSAAKTYEFEDYLPVINALKEKGHSYAEIAEFIKKRLGIEASRGQVYRAYQIWLEQFQEPPEGADDYLPEPPDEQEQVQGKIYEAATMLITELRDQESRGNNEPWNDTEVILHQALQIVTEERETAAAAESAAAEADKRLEASKHSADGRTK